MKDNETKEQRAPTFTKKQLLASDRYADQRDLINALIPDGNIVTLWEMDKKISKFKKGKVKK